MGEKIEKKNMIIFIYMLPALTYTHSTMIFVPVLSWRVVHVLSKNLFVLLPILLSYWVVSVNLSLEKKITFVFSDLFSDLFWDQLLSLPKVHSVFIFCLMSVIVIGILIGSNNFFIHTLWFNWIVWPSGKWTICGTA